MVMTYDDLYRWLQQRAALSRETKYVQVRPQAPKERGLRGVNTRVVKCKPSKGTVNMELGMYRHLDKQRRMLDSSRVLQQVCYSMAPRLVKVKRG